MSLSPALNCAASLYKSIQSNKRLGDRRLGDQPLVVWVRPVLRVPVRDFGLVQRRISTARFRLSNTEGFDLSNRLK